MRKPPHPSLSRLSSLLALLLLAGGAHAGAASPRDAVAEVASAIERNFFDAQRAHAIADELRGEAAQGRYDRYPDPRDLATALSDRLHPLDAHFRVNWRDPAQPGPAPQGRRRLPPPGAAPATATGPAPVDFSRRRNYGLRKVEVLPGNLGYIDLRELPDFDFGDDSAPARRALDAALQLILATDAVIIDLRDNGGGSPAAVGYLTSAFTAKNADIYNTFRWREGERMRSDSEAPRDWYRDPRLQVPLYLLTSPRTASAAEALAYTLQSAGRAKVIGEASAGAANPGEEIALKDGFSVFVSSGSPTNPITHKNWEGSGVAPDVAVAQREALQTAQQLALERVIAAAPAGADTLDARWTLEALRAQSAPNRDTPAAADYLGQYDRIQIGADGGQLVLRNGQRPPQALIALQRDLFFVDGNPGVRVRFERGDDGRVTALETLRADGSSNRYRR
ncbi:MULTISPECIES: S41 family peptidase [unclassified Lysobacter]|uniref:S41 family peptidase n=1 Tax=unclassified Lysobacter TaxID=2635362 RepID=UPI001BE9CB89|nr:MULTISPECIES: S41 family peptidase [unclassified Lysobacter]MBT2746641.1 hypothetical protein [Lysobacter sp. ISL-42]MBT2753364.1 hypothetical protein [Lysobacter sp. ISL-50]MBT2775474.1 hypothetical protein [Lysobacter sp. ISL-54]MBT2782990.1 hypothetical protein [Lysobacter sp. ISL-52]